MHQRDTQALFLKILLFDVPSPCGMSPYREQMNEVPAVGWERIPVPSLAVMRVRPNRALCEIAGGVSGHTSQSVSTSPLCVTSNIVPG